MKATIFAEQMIGAVKEYVSIEIAAISEKIAAQIAQIPAGPPGEKGEPGESIKGDQGEPGIAGKDADPEAIKQAIAEALPDMVARVKAELIEGIEKAFAEIPIPKNGDQGAKGDPGEPGIPGANGKDADPEVIRAEVAKAVAELPPPKDGKDVHPDTVALMVAEQVAKAVAALPKAQDGTPGRDAAQLTVLPGIDETRSYPVGTWAKYAGGEIRAMRHTDPIKDGDLAAAGWDVARDGVAAIVVTQSDDLRTIEVASMLTSGTKTVAEFMVPMVIDRGVWREGEYEKGDFVSWNGSGWIAQTKTALKPGDLNNDWRLSIKRGSDGKDWNAPNLKKVPVKV